MPPSTPTDDGSAGRESARANGPPAIRTENLELEYSDGTRAVDGLSLTVPRGAFFGFLGPNGAGKTTFIKILATLLHPTAGSVAVNGFDLAEAPQAIRETIGYMAQETSIDGELTARENLEFACRAYGVPRTDRAARIEELLELVELADVADKPAGDFSGGMKKRLDAATALVHDPPLVFLDEPTTGLDPTSRQKLWRYFESINARGQTVFLTTQYLAEANELCDSLAVIQEGQIVASGTPAELKQAVGGQVLSVEIPDSELERAVSTLLRVEGLDRENAIEVTDDGLSIPASAVDGTPVDPLVALRDADVRIERFDLREPTLDDVFHAVTGEADLNPDRKPVEVAQ